jgi:hypothetical protein
MRKDSRLIVAIVLSSALAFSAVESAGAAQPVRSVGHVAVQARVLKVKKVTFSGSYKGSIALLMVGASGQSATSVKVTSLVGKGTGTYLGSSTLRATGSAPASNQCDELAGLGSITGSGSKLTFKVVTSSKSQGCASSTATPTSVSVNGVATVTGGSGKYKGVSGTLTFKGSFSVASNTAGSSESDSFSATLKGPLTIKY